MKNAWKNLYRGWASMALTMFDRNLSLKFKFKKKKKKTRTGKRYEFFSLAETNLLNKDKWKITSMS